MDFYKNHAVRRERKDETTNTTAQTPHITFQASPSNPHPKMHPKHPLISSLTIPTYTPSLLLFLPRSGLRHKILW